MIEIETIAPIKSTRATKPKTLTRFQERTIKQYKAAYKAVYGILPTITFDGTWIRIQGQVQGVKRKRLKEMAEQLEYRAGIRE